MINFLTYLRNIAGYCILGACALLSLACIVGALLFNLDLETVALWFVIVLVGAFALFIAVALFAFLFWFLFLHKRLLIVFVFFFGALVLVLSIVTLIGNFVSLPAFDLISFLEKTSQV